jgi:hypothetical protein
MCVVVGLNKVQWLGGSNNITCGGKVVVGRQKTMTWQQNQRVWSAFRTCWGQGYMMCKNCLDNKAFIVQWFIVAVIAAQVIECSIPGHGILFSLSNNNKNK